MTIYTVVKRDTEYDDQYYSVQDGGKPVKAYKVEANAKDAADALNKEELKNYNDDDFEDVPRGGIQIFKVVSVEVDDEDIQDYATARSAVAVAREAAKNAFKGAFKIESDKLFAAHPILLGFQWTQYTPYFNDGDSCEFSVHKDYPHLKFLGDEDEGYEEYWKEEENEKTRANKAVEELLSQFDDEDLEEAFGDHRRVTVTRDGVEDEDYSHD